MRAFAAIADDLTGACDVAAELAATGRRARVVIDARDADGEDGDGSILVVNTQSRALPAPTAAARVRDVLHGRSAGLVLKKIDTALRGHLGAELDAALAAVGGPGFVLAAIPSAGRTTRGGRQWIGDRLLEATEFARDPEGPGPISSIPAVVGRESARATAVIGRDVVRSGGLADAVARARAAGIALFVVDAESDDDVRAAVDAILALPRPLCLAGSIALAAALAPHLPPAAVAPAVVDARVERPALVACGSLHSRARAQVAALLAAEEAIALAAPSCGGVDLRAFAVTAAAALARGTSVVLAAPPAAAVPRPDAMRATERALAEAVAAVAQCAVLGTLVLVGGETSHAVLTRLAAGAIDVSGRVAPLIARGRIRRGVAAGTTLITKGGSGGEVDVLTALLGAAPLGPTRMEGRG